MSLGDPSSSDIDLVPTELEDGTVAEIPHERAVDEHLQYLYRVTEHIGSREELEAHWQETAMHLFEQRYTNWLRRGTGARLRDQLLQPTQHASVDAAWSDGRREEMLVLLNVVRNESHRAVVETALELKTGDCEDRRTDEVREEVRDLVEWTEDRPFYDRPSPLRATLGALAGNLSRRLPTLPSDAS
jgi:poly-gamma-glutamate synthesis protein (capsule biosynthesis protein)